MKKILKFQSDPSFAQLWDKYTYNILFSNITLKSTQKKNYIEDLISLLKEKEITKESRILDTCSGTGFPAIHLFQVGYHIDCMDLMDDQIEMFKEKTEKLRIPLTVLKASWKEIHKYYANNSYDLLLCRGNSFIYADGGWNEKIEVDPRRALESYRITLKEFYNILKPGGFLYIDKFYDNENPQKKYVARIKIGDRPIAKLLVYLEIIPKLKIRRAQFLIHNKDG